MTSTSAFAKEGRDATNTPPHAFRMITLGPIPFTHVPSNTWSSFMSIEKNRLDSFKTPEWKCRVMDIRKLASCGFYFTGNPDHIMCAFCKVKIGNWKEGDDASIIHQRCAPRCPLFNENDVDNVPLIPAETMMAQQELLSFNPYGTLKIRPKRQSKLSLASTSSNAKKKNKIIVDRGLPRITNSIFKEYSTYQSRLNSFEDWPPSMSVRPEQLVEAGFFYTGKGDQTLCFYCGGGLRDWSVVSEPWKEHARWFSKCSYVISKKGIEFIQSACMKHSQILPPGLASTLTMAAKSKVGPPLNSVVSETPSNLIIPAHDYGLCKICYVEQLGILFLPCGHIVACVKCASVLKVCPICLQPITSSVRAFLP